MRSVTITSSVGRLATPKGSMADHFLVMPIAQSTYPLVRLSLTVIAAQTGGGAGCDGDPVVEACVCMLDPWCCSSDWDDLCAQEGIDSCGAVCW